jgi:GcrA cell cycle regulator
MSWTDERIDLLQKLWLQGLSASRIAKELSNGLTRNAVIGKVYRLGLSGRTKVAAEPSPVPRPAQRSTLRASNPRPKGPMIQNAGTFVQGNAGSFVRGNTALAMQPLALEARAPAAAPDVDVVVPITEPVTIVDLLESMCRWPLGDPTHMDFRFCGARKMPGEGPYCRCHAAIAYQPHQDRRRHARAANARPAQS